MNILNDFYCPQALDTDYHFSESEVYHQVAPDTDHKVCM